MKNGDNKQFIKFYIKKSYFESKNDITIINFD